MTEIGCAGCGSDTPDLPVCPTCGEDPLLDSRYRLLERIGQGSVGVTWRAMRILDRAVVAVKAAPVSRDARAAMLEARELRVLAEVDHPQLPRLIEALYRGVGQNRFRFLVQTHMDGEDLERAMLRRRFSALEVALLLRSAIDPLQWLHERSPPIVHRDVKPANLLLCADGTVAVVDFSAVRDANPGTLGGNTVAGTFGYMAPEQFRGDAEPASDVYGLGATAIHLLSRQHPKGLLDPAQRFVWRSLVNAPLAMTTLIDRMVSREPSKRPSLDEVSRGLERLLTQDAPITTLPAGSSAAARPPPRPEPIASAHGVTFADPPPPSPPPEDPAAPLMATRSAAGAGLVFSSALVSTTLVFVLAIAAVVWLFTPDAPSPTAPPESARARISPPPLPEARAPLVPPPWAALPDAPLPGLPHSTDRRLPELVAGHPDVVGCYGDREGDAPISMIARTVGTRIVPTGRNIDPAFAACVAELELPIVVNGSLRFDTRVLPLRSPKDPAVLPHGSTVTLTFPPDEDFVVRSSAASYRIRGGGTHVLRLPMYAFSVYRWGETNPAAVQTVRATGDRCTWTWGSGDPMTCEGYTPRRAYRGVP